MIENKKVLGVALLLGFVAIGTIIYATTSYTQIGSALLPLNGLTNAGWNDVDKNTDKKTAINSSKESDCKAKCVSADSETVCKKDCPIEQTVSVDDGTKSIWSESQTIQLSRNGDDNISLKVDYKKNGDAINRTFTGSKDEVLKAIDEDDELPLKMKVRLKENVSDETSIVDPLVERMKQHSESMKRMFSNSWLGKDWFFSHSLDDLLIRKSIFEDDSFDLMKNHNSLLDSALIQKE